LSLIDGYKYSEMNIMWRDIELHNFYAAASSF
jgi:hypothetical protein